MIARLFLLFMVVFYCTVMESQNAITYYETIKRKDSLTIHEGIICSTAQQILYKKEGETCALIELTKPVMVNQAEKEESWGFFQFPSVGKVEDGTLIVSWQMKADSHKSYGKPSDKEFTPMMSKDKGHTWKPQDKYYFVSYRGYNINMNNGSSLNIITPPAKDIHLFKKFPKSVEKKGNYSFFPIDSLPDELQGIYLNYMDKDRKSTLIHAKLFDPGALRYAIDDMMPIVWWGNIKQLSDESLIAGVYPAFYKDSLNNTMAGGVSFYHSSDNGYSWILTGKIPFRIDGIADKRGEKCFTEPAFEVLADSTFICIMRSGTTSPMYKTFSADLGKTWSVPEPFTPNGVMPRLLLLKNGVLVLASGRPGVQLRFSFDGTGKMWSDPIDMIPFMNTDGTYNCNVSCGYASIIEDGENSFYIVYSDFTTRNFLGQRRKSIWCRRVSVKRIV